jgi:hypothetical protein
MLNLSSYLNVYNTCLVILRRRGFVLAYDRTNDSWSAQKDEYSFRADNPIELLGLTTIFEEIQPQDRNEYWWMLREPNILAELDPE